MDFACIPLTLLQTYLLMSSTEQGNVRLDIGTKTPFAEAVTLIVYAKFREVLEIDKNRETSIEMARVS
ncbi:hypothetical protein B566_EDAN011079 [Ephemera danica]|nr:hypothetical protein B566_EDAN011079 [Ephemera danica]